MAKHTGATRTFSSEHDLAQSLYGLSIMKLIDALLALLITFASPLMPGVGQRSVRLLGYTLINLSTHPAHSYFFSCFSSYGCIGRTAIYQLSACNICSPLQSGVLQCWMCMFITC